MSVNEYVTKFTQLSLYAPREVDTNERMHECFLSSLNDGLTYALEAQDFENFQGMVNMALVLPNYRGVMQCKRKPVRQHQSRNKLQTLCFHTFSCICVPLCSATASVETSVDWIRIFYPAVSSGSVPQHFPDPFYWESECSEDPSFLGPAAC
jgi:hypothetical protein